MWIEDQILQILDVGACDTEDMITTIKTIGRDPWLVHKDDVRCVLGSLVSRGLVERDMTFMHKRVSVKYKI